ncbi:MAG: hypothetical protein Q9203_006120 [Teloschistes exilis]
MSVIPPTIVADDDNNDDNIDLELYRDSKQILGSIRQAIRVLIFKNEGPGSDGFPRHVRRNVRVDRTNLLARQFDAFQESPQLLDPHLEYIVSHLLHAFGGVIRCSLHYPATSDIETDVQPLPRAICQLVYTLCKVRGAKVITRFLDNDTRYLEKLSSILETGKESLRWQERYVILLWLSHLTLTPFPLESLSTSDTIVHGFGPTVFSLPKIAERLLSLACYYISSVGNEREAAKILLVRLSLRPDMQQVHLHKHCIDWALLRLTAGIESADKDMEVCSLLSFLAAFFKRGDAISVGQFVLPVLISLQESRHSPESIEFSRPLQRSAMTRKLLIKVKRALAFHLLSSPYLVDKQTDDLNHLIGHLLLTLRDKESLVRLSASKALSVVAQRLDVDMRTQLLEEIIAQYHEGADLDISEGRSICGRSHARLHEWRASVDTLHWHGLTLTLAHLLYRHCVPQQKLSAVMKSVLFALDFEQLSTTGISTGANVRDAACFGIWSLARKYTTRELLSIPISQMSLRPKSLEATSIFELLASFLLIRACFDPDGNIRRAASAGLQELVGRHPDKVPKGIELIQIVDYSSVGSRRQAISQVAVSAAALSRLYQHAECEGLFSWWGIYSPQVETRRIAATNIGGLVRRLPPYYISTLFQKYFESSQDRSFGEWHGFYLTLATAVKIDRANARYGEAILSKKRTETNLPYLLTENLGLSETEIVAGSKNPELAAEAVCRMIAASATILDHNESFQKWEDVSYHTRLLHASLRHYNELPVDVFEEAAVSILSMIDYGMRYDLVSEWLKNIHGGHNGRLKSGEPNAGWILVTGVLLRSSVHEASCLPDLAASMPMDVLHLYHNVLMKLLSKESDLDSKKTALKHLYMPVYLECLRCALNIDYLAKSLSDSLEDYTVDSRGDVGSHVRIAALEVFGKLQAYNAFPPDFKDVLLGQVSGLRLEKLDRVRAQANRCCVQWQRQGHNPPIDSAQAARHTAMLESISVLSVPYFTTVIKVANQQRFRSSMIQGLVTSAGYGNEAPVATARTALVGYLHTCTQEQAIPFCCSLILIVQQEIPHGRLARGGLELLAFILDSQPDSFIRSCQNALQGLLPSMRNSTRSSDMRVLEALVKVYSVLLRCECVISGPVKVKMHEFLYHRFQTIRVQAAAALWVFSSDERLKCLDLSLSVQEHETRVHGCDGDAGDGDHGTLKDHEGDFVVCETAGEAAAEFGDAEDGADVDC